MEEVKEQSTNSLAYIVGAIALVVVLGAAFFLRPKTAPTTLSPEGTALNAPSPTPGPITGLGCDTLYYNTKIAFNEYYVSAEGGDVTDATRVNCAFTMKVGDEVVETANASSPLTEAPDRGGATFRCTTQAVALEPNVETQIEVVLTDNLKESATCAATFLLPPGI
jgi:hypothetical protein